MADPTAKPGTPLWWRDRLIEQLEKRAKVVKGHEDWVDGVHPLPEPPSAMNADVFAEAKAAHKNLSQMGVTNFLPMVSKAPARRLSVVGFQFSDDDARATEDLLADEWQRNHMDAESRTLQHTVFDVGNGFVLVWPGADGAVDLYCEHPSQMIVAYEPGSRWRRAAALKRWVDDSGRLFCTLYLPDALYKWQTRSIRPEFGLATMGFNNWDPRVPSGEAWPLPNPFGEVPVVEFAVNTTLKARPFGGGLPEFHGVLPIQKRINKTVFDRLVTGESQAFRQRWAIGWTPPIDPETGQPDPRATYRASQSRLWTFDGTRDEVEVGEFAQADFGPFLKAVEDDARWMAVISYTPPSYMPIDLKNLGAETFAHVNAGFVAKVETHADALAESYEDVARLILKAKRDQRAGDPKLRTLWKNIEVQTLAEVGDFVTKMRGVLPVSELLARVPGATQDSVKRWMEARRVEQLEDAAGAAIGALVGEVGDGGTGAGGQPPAG